MKFRHFKLTNRVFILLVMALHLIGCVALTPVSESDVSSADSPSQALTEVPPTEVPPTEVPPSEDLAVAVPMLIHLQTGDVVISEVQVGPSYPEGCDPSVTFSCAFVAPPGRKVVAVLLEAQAGLSEDDLMNELFDAMDHDEAFITDSTGAKIDIDGQGRVYDKTVGGLIYLMAFAPLTSQSGFTLFWGDNNPVELGE